MVSLLGRSLNRWESAATIFLWLDKFACQKEGTRLKISLIKYLTSKFLISHNYNKSSPNYLPFFFQRSNHYLPEPASDTPIISTCNMAGVNVRHNNLQRDGFDETTSIISNYWRPG